MGKYSKLLVAVILAILPFTSTANAQNPYSAAYAVNDTVISYYDIDQRVKILRALGAQVSNPREVAIEQLIDDRLKAYSMRLFGIVVSDEALENGIAKIAANMNTSADGLWGKFRARGVSREAFDEYYRIQMGWREVVQGRFRVAADPTSVEIDNAINAAAAVTQETILLAEIAIPFAERGEEATMAFANRLTRDLNAGASFETAVANFSRSPSAANGGQIGWVDPSRLPANVASQVLGLGAGNVSAPINVTTGVVILKVVSSRVMSSPLRKQVSVRYAVLDLTGQPDVSGLAAKLQRNMDVCATTTSSAASYGGASGMFGPVYVDTLPADIAISLARLMPGSSELLVNGDSAKLIQLCERTTDLDDNTLGQLQNSLFGQKLTKLAEGYLLELRRNAIIERR